ncbi:hypothetical protein [Allosphingosinicella indica]|uniref:CDP-glycerol glycerophosphotransferase, TagB/SpsB family n=1 Tax=Allosphingosinicella indica TaxID=941907 RepID=A0A1X7G210_9SPHN|nr:hypothetical protein [Allosphingosinicella indica]SMF62604.1 CDP-glycerol glycerophosphotransferase, TagB/SpsB family [Allosphingosinicella indica]
MKRVGFLFNHDAAHQAAHIAGIAGALATTRTDIQTLALYSRPMLRDTVEAIVGADAAAKIEWVHIRPGPAARLAAPALDRLLPFTRLTALRDNLDLFATLDALVSTERTCLLVKRRLNARSPKIVYVPHGAGDRNVAYHPEKAGFDLFLVSGRKYVDAATRAGLLGPDNWRIIGYPKFDAVLEGRPRPRLFDNGRPAFLYNPHFDPELSSWYDFGPDLIRWFAAHPDVGNLVVAPHVMLFRKKLHYSLELKRLRIRPPIPAEASAPNILVDTGSPRLFDMHYTLGADVYIGDVSSQVYEFLAIPRACYFLDSHDGRARGGENYRFWSLGRVAGSVAELGAMLSGWREDADRFEGVQREQFGFSIDLGDCPASIRGAEAIADYLGA